MLLSVVESSEPSYSKLILLSVSSRPSPSAPHHSSLSIHLCSIFENLYAQFCDSMSSLLPSYSDQSILHLLAYKSLHLQHNYNLTFRKNINFFQDQWVLTLLLIKTVSCLNKLLSFFFKCIVLFYFFFNFALKSLELKLCVHLYWL